MPKSFISTSRPAQWVLIGGLILSLLVWAITARFVGQSARQEFDRQAATAAGLIERRFERYTDLLYGVHGLFGNQLDVSRLNFHRYVSALDLQMRFPGVQSMQFIRRVKAGEKDQFVSVVRSDYSVSPFGYPDFRIHPDVTRPEHWIITYVEPMAGNERAFGLDLFSRPATREAAERARDSGEPVITGRYVLVQDKLQRVGLVVYMPVYVTPREERTLAQRRDDLAGFVNVVFRPDDVFARALDPQLNAALTYDLHDLGPTTADPAPPSPENRLLEPSAIPERSSTASWLLETPKYSRTVTVAGRHWMIAISSKRPLLAAWIHPNSLAAFIGSLAIFGLLYLMLRNAARARADAVDIADRATHDLRQQLSFNQQLLEALPNPVFFKDVQGRYLGCNRAFEEFTGRRKEDLVGKTAYDIQDRETADLYTRTDQALLAKPGIERFEASIKYPRFKEARLVQYNKATFVGADGAVTGLVGVMVDLTDLKRAEAELTDRNQQIQAILSSSPLAIIARDFESRVVVWNAAAERLFGWTAAEVMGTTTSIVPAELKEETRQLRLRAQAGDVFHVAETVRLHKDGSRIDVSLSVGPVRGPDGKVTATMVMVEDITRRKQAESELRRNEAQLRLALESAEMATWHWNVGERAFSASGGFGALFGLARDATFQDFATFRDAIHPEDRERVDQAIQQAMNDSDDFKIEMRVIWPDQSTHWMASMGQVIRDPEGRAVSLMGVAMNITERKAAEQRIAHMAQHDALTGLPNRLLLKDRISQAVLKAMRGRSKVAVLFIDLDRFKNINDSLGHESGDRLLQTVAKRIKTCLREGDTVSRLGGDEFVIVLPEINGSHDVSVVAAKVLEVLSQPYHLQGQDLHVSASIGTALFPEDGEDAETLMRNADAAMYHAKDSGRANYQFFTEHMNIAAQRRVTMEAELRRALERKELTLAYQPVFAVATGRIVGTEALLRWTHPDRGVIAPGEFISVAEESGLIHQIGEEVLRAACAQTRLWHDAGFPMRMSVNVSVHQLRRKAFLDQLRSILAATSVAPDHLELEITESLIVEDASEALKTLRMLDDLGVRLAIDDFGTGYSGLSYLKRFPIDAVKIDQSFIRDISVDADDAAIVRAIIAMAKSLKLAVIAEGVETGEQLAFLSSLGCDFAQGYLLGRPMEAVAVTGMLAEERAERRMV